MVMKQIIIVGRLDNF